PGGNSGSVSTEGSRRVSDEQLPGQGQEKVAAEPLEPGQIPGQQVPEPTEADPAAATSDGDSRWSGVLREIVSGSATISVLAVVLAMVAGAVLIALTNENVQTAAGYFFARPGDTFSAIWDAVSGAYSSLFQGSIYNFNRPDFATG